LTNKHNVTHVNRKGCAKWYVNVTK